MIQSMKENPSSGARPLPAITISVSDYDRLAELAGDAPPPLCAYLQRELARARIVADADFDQHAARIGSRVTYREEPGGRARTVTLAWPHEADMKAGRISVVTSIGAALLGMRPRNSIDWPAPLGGPRRLTVLVVDNGSGGGPAAA
jgi:regulator of nucleoside diphosphate kinase